MTAPSSTPSTSAPTEPPSLDRLASIVHEAVADLGRPRVVHVAMDPTEETFDLGFWDVPAVSGHPIEPLVGFVAPRSWDAVGFVSSGRLRHLDRPESPPERTLTTVLFHRDGTTASVIGPPGSVPRLLDGPPEGLVPDVLNRVLGRPTPPPDQPTGALVELTWLDRILGGAASLRGRRQSWVWLADRHPLRGAGPLPDAGELAARTEAYSHERTWAGLRLLAITDDLPAVHIGPPGGSTAPACTWFDDGSLSRWLLGRLPPAEAVLPDVASMLAPAVRDALLAALTTAHLPDAAAEVG